MPSSKHIAALLILFFTSALHAAVPDSLSYQGYLTEPSGLAIDDSLSVTFSLYTTQVGGSPLWSDTRTVTIDSGLFSVDLGGTAAPFPAGLFDTPLWIGVSVAGDPEMTPRRPLTTAAFSFKADDAISLQGQGPAALDQSGDVADLNSRLSTVEMNDVLSLINVSENDEVWVGAPSGGTETALNVASGGRLTVSSNVDSGINLVELPGSAPNNPTQILFNQTATQGGSAAARLGYDFGANRGIYFETPQAGDVMNIMPDGRVGIGTNNPGSDLDVVGTARVRGNMYVGDGVSAEQDIAFSSGSGSWQVGTNNQSNGTDDNHFYIYDSSTFSYSLTVNKGSGFVGIGKRNPTTALDVDGALTIRGGADIVEGFDTSSGDIIEPGTVMVIDAEHPGKLRTSDIEYDGKVAGVVSGAGGVMPGIKLGQDGILDGDVPMAMSGRVYVKCSTENGPIRAGDRLTTSSLSGHAMRATDSARAPGAVIGKAMSELDEGEGLVLVLVNLQ